MSYFNTERLRRLRNEKRMSLTHVSNLTGVSRAQISLIENGKTDPRISTVVRLLSCYDSGLGDLDPYPREAVTIDYVSERAERGAQRIAKAGLGPSDPLARLERKADRGADVDAERMALRTRV